MVSVIVATKNREESLKRCLRALKKQSYKDFEVLIEKGGKSLAEARQLGFEKSKGEIVIYIDDDCEVTKDWLKNVLEPFKDPKVGGVSGPTVVSKDKLENRDVFRMNRGVIGWFYRNIILEGREKEVGRICKSGMWTPGANFYNGNGREDPRPYTLLNVDYLEACNMALRRSLIEKAGGFDLGFTGTSEWCEVDLVMRIKERASYDSPLLLVFNPKAVLYHHVSREGVFSSRVNGPERMKNFIRYYFKNRNNIGLGIFKYFKFLLAIAFIEAYFVYKAVEERNIKWVFR